LQIVFLQQKIVIELLWKLFHFDCWTVWK
jgi:hypothetical protein